MKKMMGMLVVLAGCMAAAWAATPAGWNDQYATAQKQSLEQKKPLMILFTGSEWCGYCKKLKADVLESKEFKDLAKSKLVLYYADFAFNGTSSAENIKLKNTYGISGYPTVVVLTPAGKLAGRIGGYDAEAGKAQYIKQLQDCVKKAAPKADSAKKAVNKGMSAKKTVK